MHRLGVIDQPNGIICHCTFEPFADCSAEERGDVGRLCLTCMLT